MKKQIINDVNNILRNGKPLPEQITKLALLMNNYCSKDYYGDVLEYLYEKLEPLVLDHVINILSSDERVAKKEELVKGFSATLFSGYDYALFKGAQSWKPLMPIFFIARKDLALMQRIEDLALIQVRAGIYIRPFPFSYAQVWNGDEWITRPFEELVHEERAYFDLFTRYEKGQPIMKFLVKGEKHFFKDKWYCHEFTQVQLMAPGEYALKNKEGRYTTTVFDKDGTYINEDSNCKVAV